MLSNLHNNHEDKLQIKNIIYHAVKDSITICEQQTNENIHQEVVNREQIQLEQDNNSNLSTNQLDNNIEENKRDALKSANLNDSSPNNKLINNNVVETGTNGKRGKGLNVNERSKRSKLNENSVVVQPQNLTSNDLNNNSAKRKLSESAEHPKAIKKNRKEHKTLKLKS